jgi:hypothetical protein
VLTSQGHSGPLRIWALLGARAGDNDQIIALAKALGLPFETKQLSYNRLHLLGPRVLGRSLISLNRSSRELIRAEPPPDLTISAGHRSVPAVQSLRRRSGGRTHSIHVGFPRISPARFDLVIATPQYAIPDHPHLLRIPYALTGAATRGPDPDDEALLARLPKPRRLLIVGGSTLYWMLNEPALLTALEAMLAKAAKNGGSVLVTTSPRTPPAITQAIEKSLDASRAPALLTAPRKSPRYASLLAAADSIWVTADSVSMVSDAIWTGKPVGLIPIARSALGRLVFGIANRLQPGRHIYPQDLRFFWRALANIGIGEHPSLPRTSTDELLRTILGRAQQVLDAL